MSVNKEMRIAAINNMVSVPTMWDTLRVHVKQVLLAMDTTAQVLECVEIIAFKYIRTLHVLFVANFAIFNGLLSYLICLKQLFTKSLGIVTLRDEKYSSHHYVFALSVKFASA